MSDFPREPEPANERSASAQEREVKFTADRALFKKTLAAGKTTGTIQTRQKLNSVYFDTAGLALRKAGIVLRVRHDTKTSSKVKSRILGVKLRNGGGAFARAEEEIEVNADIPDIDLFRKEIRDQLQQIIAGQKLLVQFTTKIERRTFLINQAELQIEMAFDQGAVDGTQCSVPLSEIELEQKSGSPAAFYDYASKFCLTHSLTLDFVSKSDKGFQMIGADVSMNSSDAGIKLKKSNSAAKAAIAIIKATSDHFTWQWVGCRNGNDADAVHQARVELRRLRSAFSIFREILPQPEAKALDIRCKEIADGFAMARKLDVFLAAFKDIQVESTVGQATATSLSNALEPARRAAYQSVKSVLDAAKTSALVIDIHRFVEMLDSEPATETRIGSLAQSVVERLYAKALKRGRKIANLTPLELHRLRITLKKLRYGIEFFIEILDNQKKWKKRIKTIKQLQETLGSLNDVAETQNLLDSTLGAKAQNHASIIGFVLGWQTRDSAEKKRELTELWHDFKTEM